MNIPPFRSNAEPTLGVELELMLINEHSADLEPKAVPILHDVGRTAYANRVTLEVTQSMIEINSSVHPSHTTLHAELAEISRELNGIAAAHGAHLCAGGAHPFHRWQERRLSPGARFQEVGYVYGYLAKQFTVFGQHIHVGCLDGEDAISGIHRLSSYVPHFIAIAAASPFYRGVDTGFDSCRSNVVAAFPLSGRMPQLDSWAAFLDFFARIERLGIATSLKDLYWDIRPKPEFGTIELRVPDTPLDLRIATDLAAYAQALLEWGRRTTPASWLDDWVYRHNRFQAARFGFDGQIVVSELGERCSIADHLRYTLDQCASVAHELKSADALDRLNTLASDRRNGAAWMRAQFEEQPSLPDLVRRCCSHWSKSLSV